jgi:hypothetical protein
MFKVQDNSISVVRGDSCILELAITDQEGNEYIVSDTDVIVFTVKKNPRATEVVFQKKVIDKKITIDPEDTARLPYGKYAYDVQLTTVAGYVDTIIPPHSFNVLGEVSPYV